MMEMRLDEVKEVQLTLLALLDSYCRAQRLEYYLAYGTLLGAARHKGYIPWDDDIDIVMPRPSYDAIVSSYNECNTGAHIYSCFKTSGYPFPFAKLSSNATLLKEDSDYTYSELGVNIDIFPLDGLPKYKNSRNWLIFTSKILRGLRMIKSIPIKRKRTVIKNTLLAVGKVALGNLDESLPARLIDKTARLHAYSDSEYVVSLTSPYREVLPKIYFNGTVQLEFEKGKYPAPIGYSSILEQLYGNYMELPSVEKRETHHGFRAYWKNGDDTSVSTNHVLNRGRLS